MNLAPTLVVPPVESVVSLDELKSSLRISHSHEDDFLARILAAAVSRVDGYDGVLGKALINQTWSQKFSHFSNCMRLPIGKASSIVSIEYYDTLNVLQTASSSLFGLYSDDLGPFVELLYNQQWPQTYTRRDAVEIKWVCGFGATSASVPQKIRHAIILLASQWYENRSFMDNELLPKSVQALLFPSSSVPT